MSGYANPSANSNVSLFRELFAPANGQVLRWWLKPVTILVSMLLLTSMLSSMFSGLAGITGARGSLLSDPSGSSGVPDSLKALLTIGAATFIGGCTDSQKDTIEKVKKDPYGLSIYEELEKQMAEQAGEQPDSYIEPSDIPWPITITTLDGTTKIIASEAEFLNLECEDLMRPMGGDVYDCSLFKLAAELRGYEPYILFPENEDGSNDFIIDGDGRNPEITACLTGDRDHIEIHPIFNQAFVDKYKGANRFSRDRRLIKSGTQVRFTLEDFKDFEPLEFYRKDGMGWIHEVKEGSGLYKPYGLDIGPADSAGSFGKDSKGNVALGIDFQEKDTE